MEELRRWFARRRFAIRPLEQGHRAMWKIRQHDLLFFLYSILKILTCNPENEIVTSKTKCYLVVLSSGFRIEPLVTAITVNTFGSRALRRGSLHFRPYSLHPRPPAEKAVQGDEIDHSAETPDVHWEAVPVYSITHSSQIRQNRLRTARARLIFGDG